MFRFLAAVVVGAGCGYVAAGGRLDPDAIAKGSAVGLVAAYIVFIGLACVADVAAARKLVESMNDDLGERRPGLASLAAIESSASLRGNRPGVAEVLARRKVEELSQHVAKARWVASAAVYIGLFGTLVGLTIAVTGLRGLGSDVEGIKEQILSVVSGFGGSFACALCGIFVTVTVSRQLSRFDGAVDDLETGLETHLAEVILPSLPSAETGLALVVADAVSRSLDAKLAGFWLPFVQLVKDLAESSKRLDMSTRDLKSQSEEALAACKSLTTAAIGAKDSTASACAASLMLKNVSDQILPVLQRIEGAASSLEPALGRLEPAFAAFDIIRTTVGRADAAMASVHGSLSGIAAAVRDEAKKAGEANLAEISKQQSQLVEQLKPAFASLATAVAELQVVLNRADDMVRLLPVAAPASRIVDDLRAAGVESLKSAERDNESIRAASERLGQTETRISAALLGVRDAHADLSAAIDAIGRQSDQVRTNVEAISTHLDKPFWKRLGGRRG